MLGYYIDPTDAAFQRHLAAHRGWRIERLEAMTQKLNILGKPVDFNHVLALAKGGAAGRPHLADAMVEMGYVSHRQEAFDRYLKKDGPAYLPGNGPPVTYDIFRWIFREAGGIPVLAPASFLLYVRVALRILAQGGINGAGGLLS